MKFTAIFAYEGESWSTPLSIVNEFSRMGWKTDIISIGSNKSGKYHDINLKNWIESKPETDIVMFFDWGRFDSPFLDKKLVDAFWIQESGDDPQNFHRNCTKAHKFHLTLTPDHDSYIEYLKMGVNCRWWTHFADSTVHFPMNLKPAYTAVTTRGVGNSEFLDTLYYHGNGTFGNKNNLNFKEHTEFLNSAPIVVQNSRWGEITRRIFEGMACGCMVLTDRLNSSKKLDELFTDGTDIVFYDDIEDCINKINYYTSNMDVLYDIAYNGYRKVITKHTQEQRVKDILYEYEKN